MFKFKRHLSIGFLAMALFGLVGCGSGGTTTTTNPGGGTATDTTPPTVLSTNPVANANSVIVNSPVAVTFSEAMKATTINATTFTVKAGLTNIVGTVLYNGTTKTATFTPSSNLASNTLYTATITTGVKDLAGNALASNNTWSFTTIATSSVTSLPKTGQTTSYATGDDGELQNGVAWTAPRFTNGTGAEAECVTDNLTGLMWVKSPDITTRTWQVALDYANSLTLCGYSDWRLPNPKELRSLVDYSKHSPALPTGHPFLNVQSGRYWSSSTFAYFKDFAWYVDMWYGFVYYFNKTGNYYVWPVRAGQDGSLGDSVISLPETGQTTCYDSAGSVISCTGTGQDGDLQKGVVWPAPRFTVGTGAEAECVTDNLTGLMWVKSPDSTTRPWQQALDYANGLTLCGYSDWRLPNVNELESLANIGQSDTATWLNGQGFSTVQSFVYWSATTYASITNDAWFVHMWYGYLSSGSKTGYNYYVWPVRGGQ